MNLCATGKIEADQVTNEGIWTEKAKFGGSEIKQIDNNNWEYQCQGNRRARIMEDKYI